MLALALRHVFYAQISVSFPEHVYNTFCIALPIQVNGCGEKDHMSKDIDEYVTNLGFKTMESDLVYIHSSLTREIMVYEKPKPQILQDSLCLEK